VFYGHYKKIEIDFTDKKSFLPVASYSFTWRRITEAFPDNQIPATGY